MREYFDISPLIHSELAVFPGDTAFKRHVTLSFEKGDSLELSSVTSTLHIGAHADAPSHYQSSGQSIEARSLDLYMGPCQVIEASAPLGARIESRHLKTQWSGAPRVLLKTNSFLDVDHWHNNFNSLHPELIEFWAQKGLRLIGIDTPSVDPASEKHLWSHDVLFKYDMAVLEGLVLQEVPEGLYELIALPLKLKGADASPVRAILRPHKRI